MLQVEEKIHVLETPALPPSRFRFTRFATRALNTWVVRSAITALGMRPLVLLFGVPYNHRLIGQFGEQVSVFDDSGANWLEFSTPSEKVAVENGYNRIRDKADVIVAATDFMRHYFDRRQGAVELLPQGVDLSLFGQHSVSVPDDLKRLPRPWLGYVGVLEERLDLAIVESLVDAFPNASIVFVGPLRAREMYFSRLREKPNVHFLGQRAYRELPHYVCNFDVSIIPHKVNSETLSQRSMKFYERLATGKPTVTTLVPPALEFADLAHLASTPDAFVAATRRALEENDLELMEARRHRASQESWDCRAVALLKIIGANVEQRAGSRGVSGDRPRQT